MTAINAPDALHSHKPHRYPWWLAFMLTSPARRLIENSSLVLGDIVRPGQTVLELGPGNGYFSVPIAEALGPDGKLIAIDIQPQMLRMLARRLRKRGLDRRLVTRQTDHVEAQLGDLSNTVDLVVAINVIHELPKPRETILALGNALRENGQFLLVEPKGHVSAAFHEAELGWARESGLCPAAEQRTAGTRRWRTCLRKSPNPVTLA